MALLSTRKSKLAAVGAAGVFGALAFGGIAYAVGGDDPVSRSEYVTVTNDGTEDQPSTTDRRDCPEKNGGQPDQQEQQPAPSDNEQL